MKRIIIYLLLMLPASIALAGTPSAELEQKVASLADACPLDISNGWVIQTVSVDNEAVTVTMIMDTSADAFEAGKTKPEEIKQHFLESFSKRARRQGGLISEAVNSNLPLEVDIVNPSSIETITLNFTPAELSSALAAQPSK